MANFKVSATSLRLFLSLILYETTSLLYIDYFNVEMGILRNAKLINII